MTILDLAPRLADRLSVPTQRPGLAPVRRLGRASVTQLPDAAARRRHDSGADLAIESLSLMLIQADGFSRDLRLGARDRTLYAGQVQGYAFAVGITVHPDDPENALQIKRDILSRLAGGSVDAGEIRAIALTEPVLPDDAC